MSVYSLTFDLIGVFSGGVPQLNVAYGDQDLGTQYAYSGTTSVNLTIDTGSMGFDSTLLRFTFLENTGEVGDAVRLTNLKIDGNDLDTSSFSTDRGGYFHDGILNLSQGGYTEYDASVYVTDTMLNPPSGPTTPLATITGTAGDDNRLYGTDDAGDVIDALGGNDYVVAFSGNDTVNGGEGNDYVKGQGGVDTLNGDAGADRLYGGLGNDIVNGGADNDRVYGNAGNDTVSGDGGNDRVYGNAGDDDLYGGTGNDQLSGGTGSDDLFGEDGDDHLFGGDGNDILRGGNNNDRLRGNAGNDELHGDAGDDDLNGQDGNDTLYGGTGSDTLNGEDGTDILNGDDDNDYLIGGQGADTLNGGDGDDVLYGGGMSTVDQYTIRDGSAFGLSGVSYNEETQSFYRFVTTTANITSAIADASTTLLNGVAGHLVNITTAEENAYIDSLIGTNAIWIGASDSNVEGQWEWIGGVEGGTTFWQGTGSGSGGAGLGSSYSNWNGSTEPNDYGSGEDYAEYRSNDVWNDLQSGSRRYVIEWNADEVMVDNSIDTLNGGAGDDHLYGGAGNDILNGDANNDILYGQDGADTIDGGLGHDLIFGGDGNDIITDFFGTNTIYGDAGNDDITSGSGTDTVYGGSGDDTIRGGGGNDTIYGDLTASGSGSSGWNYEYYDYGSGTNPSNLNSAGFTLNGGRDNSFTLTGSGVTTDLNPASIDSGDYYSLKFEATLTITTAGTYTFRTASDDGSALFLDGVQIINNDGLHGTVTITSAGQSLSAGTYTLEATYFERTGGNTMNVLMAGPDTGGGYVGLGSYGGVTPITPVISSGGDDDIYGGAGLDTLYGGGGTDTFIFEAASAFANTDVIMDFSTAEGDILDISDIVTGFTGTITDHIQFVDSGSNTLVQVDADGVGGYSTIGQINGITGLDEATLYGNGEIVV